MKCVNITAVNKQMKYKTLLLLINRWNTNHYCC
jgi:hypothetical protein